MKKFLMIAVVVTALWFGVSSTASDNRHYCYDGCYVVQYGDTLFAIGRQYDLHPYYIAEVNGLYDPNHIYAGQVLYIPNDGPGYPWHAGGGCGYNDCGWQGSGWQQSSYYYDGCGSDCGWNGGWNNGCGSDCGWNGGWDHGCGSDCGWNGGWDHGCGSGGCGSSYSGYDYSGYHYGSNYPYQQYNYTCGYYSNCY